MLVPQPPAHWLEQWASPAARGDDEGPWTHWLPYAWRCCADIAAEPVLPSWSPDFFRPDERTIAYWGPLLQLCLYRLGWVQPEQGLIQWMDGGRDTSNGTLALIERWWGPHLEDFVAWAFTSGSGSLLGAEVAEGVGGAPPLGSGPWAHTPYAVRLIQGAPQQPEWQRTWGSGGDPLHLSAHALDPVLATHGAVHIYRADPPYLLLLLSEYRGWYRVLHERMSLVQPLANGRSWRVTVICEPVGILGRFRLSRETGRWFAGAHRWHQLGARTVPGPSDPTGSSTTPGS